MDTNLSNYQLRSITVCTCKVRRKRPPEPQRTLFSRTPDKKTFAESSLEDHLIILTCDRILLLQDDGTAPNSVGLARAVSFDTTNSRPLVSIAFSQLIEVTPIRNFIRIEYFSQHSAVRTKSTDAEEAAGPQLPLLSTLLSNARNMVLLGNHSSDGRASIAQNDEYTGIEPTLSGATRAKLTVETASVQVFEAHVCFKEPLITNIS